MSKPYYNYANIKPKNEVVNTDPEVVNADPVINNDTPAPEPESVIGTVVKCAALNIRAEAYSDADIVCVVPAGSQLMIDADKSSAEWLSVCTEAGREGFCLSDYVSID